jgi:hypothetical protein
MQPAFARDDQEVGQVAASGDAVQRVQQPMRDACAAALSAARIDEQLEPHSRRTDVVGLAIFVNACL